MFSVDIVVIMVWHMYTVSFSLTLVDLQINAVSPVMQLKPHFEDKPISEQILK